MVFDLLLRVFWIHIGPDRVDVPVCSSNPGKAVAQTWDDFAGYALLSNRLSRLDGFFPPITDSIVATRNSGMSPLATNASTRLNTDSGISANPEHRMMGKCGLLSLRIRATSSPVVSGRQ